MWNQFFCHRKPRWRMPNTSPEPARRAPADPGPEQVIRTRLLRWLAELKIQPGIVGEFDDSALMQAFGQSGTGVFIAPSVIADEVMRQFDVELIVEKRSDSADRFMPLPSSADPPPRHR